MKESTELCFEVYNQEDKACKNSKCRFWINCKSHNNCTVIAAKQGPMTLQEIGEIFGVDVDEQAAAREDKSQYRPAHAGWVGIQTYTDNHGNQRVKTEVFVAMSGIQTGNNPYPNYKQ